jgi:hypothetical protein
MQRITSSCLLIHFSLCTGTHTGLLCRQQRRSFCSASNLSALLSTTTISAFLQLQHHRIKTTLITSLLPDPTRAVTSLLGNRSITQNLLPSPCQTIPRHLVDPHLSNNQHLPTTRRLLHLLKTRLLLLLLRSLSLLPTTTRLPRSVASFSTVDPQFCRSPAAIKQATSFSDPLDASTSPSTP